MFDGIVEDRKQQFRFEQIETEGNDPVESGEKAGDDDDDLEMARRGEWGGSEPDPARYEINKNGATKDSQRDAVKYQREKYGKREFKGGSPLYPGKGSTIVKAEGLLNQLKQRFNKNTKNKSILSEENLIKDEEISE